SENQSEDEIELINGLKKLDFQAIPKDFEDIDEIDFNDPNYNHHIVAAIRSELLLEEYHSSGIVEIDKTNPIIFEKPQYLVNSMVMNNIGFIYKSGNFGIKKDIHKAIELLERSCNLGNSDAMINL